MNPEKTQSLTRINKFLAFHLGVSRREADRLVSEQRVRIDGSIADLGSRVSQGQSVELDNAVIELKNRYCYLLLHKPVGYVCSRKSQGGKPTIYSLLPNNLTQLKSVGRLDADSSGLIMLTDDGDYAHQMTHPSHSKTKLYEITLNKDLEPLHQQMISDFGVTLEDGISKFMLERQSEDSRKNWFVTMTEGRNRQIRRTFISLGYSVKSLHRIRFGSFSIGNLKPGEYKEIMVK